MASGDSHVVVILGERHGLRYPVASLLMDPGAIDVHAHHRFLWHATPASEDHEPPSQGSSNFHHLTPPTPLSWAIMCKSPTYFGVFKISKAGYCARWWTLSGRFGDLKVDRGSAPRSCTPTLKVYDAKKCLKALRRRGIKSKIAR